MLDYDECALGTDSCEEDCVNSPGGYMCTCPPGYSLHQNGFSCISKLCINVPL